VDDIALTLVSVPNPVPSAGHFNRALLGIFSQAPKAAVELARQHGVYPVAHPLRLDYTRLKKRLGGFPTSRRKAAKPAFVELVAPSRVQLEECVIEFESSGGSKMRIQWKAALPPDWTALLRAWRETKG
jgi:hypothetical protein